LPPERGRALRPSIHNRQALGGITRIARTRAPRRGAPERLGKWNAGLALNLRWPDARGFQGLPEALAAGGIEGATIQMVDNTAIQAHWHESQSHESGSRSNASGQSRVSFSAKIHVLTQAHGVPMAVRVTPGRTADISAASTLLAGAEQRPLEVLADKGHDSDELRADVHLQASHPLIAWTSNRKQPGTLDPARYVRPDRI
jgi:transposase